MIQKLDFAHADQRLLLQRVLTLLTTRFGVLLTGHTTPFPILSLEERERVLMSWEASRFAALRSLFKVFKSLSLYSNYAGGNYPEALGYDLKRDYPLIEESPSFYEVSFELFSGV